MQRLDPTAFFSLGRILNDLHKVVSLPEVTFANSFFEIEQAIDELDRFERVAGAMLKVSSPLLHGLKDQLQTLHDHFYDSSAEGHERFKTGVKVPGWQLGPTASALRDFETVLKAEASGSSTYLISSVAIFDTEALIDSAEESFSKDVRKKLIESELSDVRQAGRCLALRLHTASGFHILRAIESVLKCYAKILIPDIDFEKRRTWGSLINAIRESDVDEKDSHRMILNMLDHIKDGSRNQIMHPTRTLSEEESIRLFNEAVAIIMQMSQTLSLPKAEPSGFLGSLLLAATQD